MQQKSTKLELPHPGPLDWFMTNGVLLRLAASGLLPAKWFLPDIPASKQLAARNGTLSLEIVSHCWEYSHLLAYQLSSLVLYPQNALNVTMTVFHSAEDSRTVELLDYFAGIRVPGVSWNWQVLPRERLMRRSIGRNIAAHATRSDWIWYTDCDVVFHDGCLVTLAEVLQDRRDALVYPRQEWVTALLPESDTMLTDGAASPHLLDIDVNHFHARPLTRATGPMQITHGDVARSVGYCECLKLYQTPSDKWCKAHEDRAYRWLLRSQGVGLDIPGVYRIRHAVKGRYTGSRRYNALRGWLRSRNERRKART